MSAVAAPEVRRGRGRPALAHDNRRVMAFVGNYASAFEMVQDWPCLDDVLTGVTLLHTEGQGFTRPLSKFRLFLVLQRCPILTSKAVAEALGGCCQSTAVRYAAIARVASKATEWCLTRHPEWEREAALLEASRDEIDGPVLDDGRLLDWFDPE